MAAIVDHLILKNSNNSSETVKTYLENNNQPLIEFGELVVTTGTNDNYILTRSGANVVKLPGYRAHADIYWDYVNLLINAETGNLDKSSSNLTASVNSATLSTSSKHGDYSYQFTGTNRITFNSSSVARPTNLCTIDTWVYFNNLTQNRGIFTHEQDSINRSIKAEFNSTSGLIEVTIYTSTGTYSATSSTSPQLNTWHHVAIVRNDSELTVYLDGVAGASIAVSGNFITASYWTLGANGQLNSVKEYLEGYLDDFRFTKNIARYRKNFTPSAYPAGTEFGYHDELSLTALTDINITNPVAGQTLIYNGSQWINDVPAASSINVIQDVNITSPVIGDYLIYNGSAWVNTEVNSSWFIPADGGNFNTGTVASEGNYILNGGVFT